MAAFFYADATVVTLGEKFSTNFRFLRKAVASPVNTYVTRGATIAVNGGLYCVVGPWSLTTSAAATVPSAVSTAVAL